MGAFNLITFPDSQALADAVATDWLAQVPDTPSPRAYCVALSGGRIARQFFDTVARQAEVHHRSLGTVHFFWGDERCVPPDDPESNYGLAQQHLLNPLAVAPDHIHRIHGEIAPDAAASAASSELRRVAGDQGGAQPVFDLVFLGLGEDGHVASLFPGESENEMTDGATYRPVLGAKPPPHRITLGYPGIAAAREVWVLASGPGKSSALGDSLAPGRTTPLARVIRLRAHTWIFTDCPGVSGSH